MGIVTVSKSGHQPPGSLHYICRGEPCCAPGGKDFIYSGGLYIDQSRRASEDGFKPLSNDIRCNWCRARDEAVKNRAVTQRISHLEDIIRVALEHQSRYGRHTKVAFVADFALQCAQKELTELKNGRG